MKAASYLAAAARFEEAISFLQRDEANQEQHTWLLLEVSEAYRYVDTPRALGYLDIARERGRELGDAALATVASWLRGRTRALAGEQSLDDLDQALAAYERLTDDDPKAHTAEQPGIGRWIRGARADVRPLWTIQARN